MIKITNYDDCSMNKNAFIAINKDYLHSIKFKIIKMFISRRAYKGYLIHCSDTGYAGLSYKDFKKFPDWIIALNFAGYLNHTKGVKIADVKLNFKTIFFNKV